MLALHAAQPALKRDSGPSYPPPTGAFNVAESVMQARRADPADTAACRRTRHQLQRPHLQPNSRTPPADTNLPATDRHLKSDMLLHARRRTDKECSNACLLRRCRTCSLPTTTRYHSLRSALRSSRPARSPPRSPSVYLHQIMRHCILDKATGRRTTIIHRNLGLLIVAASP